MVTSRADRSARSYPSSHRDSGRTTQESFHDPLSSNPHHGTFDCTMNMGWRTIIRPMFGCCVRNWRRMNMSTKETTEGMQALIILKSTAVDAVVSHALMPHMDG